MQLCTAVVEKKLQTVFYHFGLFIGRRPWQIIIAVIVMIVLSVVGLLNFEQINNTRTEFTPTNAPSRKEYDVVEHFLQRNGSLFFIHMMIQAKDGGSLLRAEERHEVLKITHELQYELKVTKNGQEYGFRDMCEPYCSKNEALTTFLKIYDSELRKPTYPVMDNFGMRTFLGNNIYGVVVNNKTGEVEGCKTAVLNFFLVVRKEDEDVMKKWEKAAQKLAASGKYSHLDAGMISDNLIAEEVKRMGSETAPMLVGSIIFMILFVMLTSFRYQRRRSKPWVALVGAIIPIFANISAIGFLSACGLKFQSIVVCTLFLVLAVGCDSVFVMLRAWDVSKVHTDVVTRMGVTMKDAGPSITITSLTNALAFAVDIFTLTPAIQTFSIYSTVACTVCYIYQILLFSAVLALSGRREEKGMQAILVWKKADPEATYSILRWLKKVNAAVIYRWSRIITSWPVKIGLVFVLLAYWYGALYGLLSMKTDISVQKLALPNSYIVKYKNAYEKAITAMQPVTVVVEHPGDLTKPAQLSRLKKMVKDFETASHSYGPDSTFFWLTAYQEFLAFYEDEGNDAFSYTEIPVFLKSASYSFWRAYLHINETACYDNRPSCIEQFLFSTGFHSIVEYVDMIPLLYEWRGIAANYSDMEVTAYNERSPFVDQADQLAQNLYTNVPFGIVCMVIVCIVFIPNVVSIVCAILSVVSISFGVFGYLSLSGVDLDPLSLAALLMSIGFSVDYTAHISYHYYKFTSKTNPTERVEQTLRAIGWPTMQGGLATAFAMWPLLLKRSYLAIVFLKTVVLVIFLGLAHSMIVLPALLTSLDWFNCNRRDHKSSEEPSTDSSNSSGRNSLANITVNLGSDMKNPSS